jgi:hypothetical protein
MKASATKSRSAGGSPFVVSAVGFEIEEEFLASKSSLGITVNFYFRETQDAGLKVRRYKRDLCLGYKTQGLRR